MTSIHASAPTPSPQRRTTARKAAAAPPPPPDTALPEGSPKSWYTQSFVLAHRQLVVLLRDRATVLQILLIPALTMIMFKVVLGDAVGKATGQDSAYGTVPLVILVSAMFGSIAAGVRLNLERGTGLLGRLYVLPINRGADLTSRVISEVVRITLTTAILLAAGTLIGFRFTQGPFAVVGILGVALLFGIAFSIFVLALAVNARPTAPIVPVLSLISSLLMFFNSGFSPLDAYPAWLQPIVEHQPMTPAIEVMRAFAAGGPITANLIAVIAWSAGLIVIFTYPALHGYRKAATSR
ncbi:ABC transporter permease [Gordonia bronchialis]|uniref:ABC transporter permease n=1 Tax=Gordonia bronchialis TaxID=2054 RepID=UPI001CBE3922|nr:ABC transporter permease [Gordonia bronchialis]UAK40183.1 ABC transporter permease [Gordonia bronchialis]